MRRRGRPKKSLEKARSKSIIVRLQPDEKEAFKEAAEVAGMQLSPWIRDRLRRASQQELGQVGRQAAFAVANAMTK